MESLNVHVKSNINFKKLYQHPLQFIKSLKKYHAQILKMRLQRQRDFSIALIINMNILTNFWGRSIPRGSIFNELSYK